MGRLYASTNYHTLISRLGLTDPEAYLQLDGVIYCGHHDRHVRSLELQFGSSKVAVFLKREHRVPVRDRLVNWMNGFGWVSKSVREYVVLCKLMSLDFPCPEPIAAGETASGQAFLLLRAVEGTQDLRCMVQESDDKERMSIASQLGRSLATLHNHGIVHNDLYSKHVLVDQQGKFVFLDWQRACVYDKLAWKSCRRDLATLFATLSMDHFGTRARRHLFSAYWQEQRTFFNLDPETAFRRINALSNTLQKRRRIREMQQIPLPAGQQNLIWLDGESWCVTKKFHERTNGVLPDLLRGIHELPAGSYQEITAEYGTIEHRCVEAKRSLWNRFRSKPVVSKEFRHARSIFHLERCRIRVPRLLAVGQRRNARGQLSSFLLTESIQSQTVAEWLKQNDSLTERRAMLREAASVLHAIHKANHMLGTQSQLVIHESHDGIEIGVDRVSGMRTSKRSGNLAGKDFSHLHSCFSSLLTRTEQLYFLLNYHDEQHLTPDRKNQIQRLLRQGDATLSRRCHS